jgi:hypothetical protein
MTADPEALRAEIRDLYARHQRGDLRDKDFQKSAAQRAVDLYRVEIGRRLEADERILVEHHVVSAHLRLNQSLLKESDQHATSLYVTDRRLIRLRSVLSNDRPVTCDERDSTLVDEVGLDCVRGMTVRREVRTGEVLAGISIVLFAVLFRSWLLVTGKLMVLLGVLGMVHGLLLPTRWIEVQTGEGGARGEPMRVFGARRKSGRLLVRCLRARVESGGANAA